MEYNRQHGGFFSKFGSINYSHAGDEITYNILFEHIKSLDILYAPEKCSKRFKWYASIPGDRFDEEQAVEQYRKDMLFLCHKETAKILLNMYPSCFCLVATSEDEVPSWVHDPGFSNRVLFVRSNQRFYYYDTLLQSLFVNDLLWRNEMDRLVYYRSRLDRIIEISEDILCNFVCVTDTGYNLIACSKTCKPEYAGYRYLLENRCCAKEDIEYISEEILSKFDQKTQLTVQPADDLHPYPIFHYPIFIEGSYLFHISMECKNGSIEYLKDIFLKFIRRASSMCKDFWKTTVNLESPWHRVLIGLIDGESMTMDYLRTQLAMSNLIGPHSFRLLLLRYDAHMAYQMRTKVLEAAKHLNDGSCYLFMYKEDLLVLCYSTSDDDGALSGRAMEKTVGQVIQEPFGLAAYSSQVFHRITDIKFAYRQAELSYLYRDLLTLEEEYAYEDFAMSVFPFEHMLKFYLLEENRDPDLVEFSFKTSILRRLFEEDKEAGTEIARLLWVYLSCDRNATETARRVHVHRNTVLYHINRIQERFDFDLNSPLLKSRIVLDYLQLMVNGETGRAAR